MDNIIDFSKLEDYFNEIDGNKEMLSKYFVHHKIINEEHQFFGNKKSFFIISGIRGIGKSSFLQYYYHQKTQNRLYLQFSQIYKEIEYNDYQLLEFIYSRVSSTSVMDIFQSVKFDFPMLSIEADLQAKKKERIKRALQNIENITICIDDIGLGDDITEDNIFSFLKLCYNVSRDTKFKIFFRIAIDDEIYFKLIHNPDSAKIFSINIIRLESNKDYINKIIAKRIECYLTETGLENKPISLPVTLYPSCFDISKQKKIQVYYANNTDKLFDCQILRSKNLFKLSFDDHSEILNIRFNKYDKRDDVIVYKDKQKLSTYNYEFRLFKVPNCQIQNVYLIADIKIKLFEKIENFGEWMNLLTLGNPRFIILLIFYSIREVINHKKKNKKINDNVLKNVLKNSNFCEIFINHYDAVNKDIIDIKEFIKVFKTFDDIEISQDNLVDLLHMLKIPQQKINETIKFLLNKKIISLSGEKYKLIDIFRFYEAE